jgi:hypothetical protein
MRNVLLAAACAACLLPGCGNDGDDGNTIINTIGAVPPASGTLLYVVQSGATAILVNVSPTNPSVILRSTAISGLSGTVHGIDYRPATGQLYATNTSDRLYLIDAATGVALEVGTVVFSTGLSGTNFGFDFNPTVDRIRVVSNFDQNLRINPDTGAIASVDGTLAYAAADPNFGNDAGVAGAAYTNNFAGATTTTLYAIDVNLGVLATINPPNTGVLNTVGALGVFPSLPFDVGFDISSTGVAYAAIALPSGPTQLYTINLTTGAATLVGTLGAGGAIRGLAIVP